MASCKASGVRAPLRRKKAFSFENASALADRAYKRVKARVEPLLSSTAVLEWLWA
jgi:hypothetical protein